ncbi:hypothetical protein [Tuwongella immobilis]|uniref:Uncharacterized protein n=1 Tax=Tuwongella immobilis TaxID=692036 RepID=A0A6C2YSF5_9BACT|nr:hypothetical protein [Tuwongella immobilis]VIP04618.1 unnamed protein product [Tuwongella immobilis]VTS06597.1 unnamed protein product [Tuwongella immobilis]
MLAMAQRTRLMTLLGLLLCGSPGFAQPRPMPMPEGGPTATQPASGIGTGTNPGNPPIPMPTSGNGTDNRPWQALKLPTGTIIFVSRDAKELQQKLDAVVLTPEQFKELTDQIDTLKRQSATEPPQPPSIAQIHGRLEQLGQQSIIRLSIRFDFETARPRSTIFLGCQKAQPSAITLDDGRLPLLFSSEEGLSVLIDTPGRHRVQLELEVPLTTRDPKGNEVGFQLGLPGSPITRLTFDAIPKISSVQVGSHRVDAAPRPEMPPLARLLDSQRMDIQRLIPQADREPLALGPIDYLEVSWEPPALEQKAPSPNADPLLSVQNDISVQVRENEILTTAQMRLRGPAKEWQIFAPLVADFTVERISNTPGDDLAPRRPASELPIEQAPVVIRPTDRNQPPIWKIQFRERATSDLLVTIAVRTVRPASERERSTASVGPFVALGVPMQSGNIRVVAPNNLRVTFTPRGDVRRVDRPIVPRSPNPSEAESTNFEAAFRYAVPPLRPGQLPTPPLEMEIRPIQGNVQTQVQHQLLLSDNGWRVISTIEVTPFRMEVDRLDLAVPPELQNPEATSPERELVESVTPVADAPKGERWLTIRLAQARRTPFKLVFEGYYPLPLTAQDAVLKLPRVLRTIDRSGEVSVQVPDGVDLRGSVAEWEIDRVAAWTYPLIPQNDLEAPIAMALPGAVLSGSRSPRSNRLTASVRRSPAQVDLSWRPLRSDLIVDTQTELTLKDRQAVILQQLRIQPGEPAPRLLRLRGPANVAGVRLLSGGRSLEPTGAGEWTIPLLEPVGREINLSLTYVFTLPESTNPNVPVPLLWIDNATQTETRLRIWRDGSSAIHLIPRLADGPWQEQPTEFVPDRDVLPALVLSGSGNNLPLTLSLTEMAGSTFANLWVDRMLVQVRHADTGTQDYRVRMLVRRWLSSSLDCFLPATPELKNFECYLDDRRIDNWEMLPDAPPGMSNLRMFRIPMPSVRNNRPMLVELRYQLSTARRDGVLARLTRWELPLTPPKLEDGVFLGTVRWQIAMPDRWVPLSLSDSLVPEQRWMWNNGLFTVQPIRSTAELDRWFTGGIENSPTPLPMTLGEANAVILTGRQPILEELRIVTMPRTAWLLICSLTTLLGGLLLVRLPRGLGWVLALLVAVGMVMVGIIWPQVAMQILFGMQPGFLALVAVLGLFALLDARYRQRRANLPGFSRAVPASAPVPVPVPVAVPAAVPASHPPGVSSSKVRRGSREPSTVDSPKPPEPWANGSESPPTKITHDPS